MSTVNANIARAAKILSMRPADIVEADEAPAGFVMTTRDGVRMVDVPEDQPDAEGKTGLMLLVKPNPKRTYAFPVYAQPVDADDETEPESETEPQVPAPPRAGRGSGVKAWRKFADAVGVDLGGATSRDDVIAACEAAGVIDKESTDG